MAIRRGRSQSTMVIVLVLFMMIMSMLSVVSVGTGWYLNRKKPSVILDPLPPDEDEDEEDDEEGDDEEERIPFEDTDATVGAEAAAAEAEAAAIEAAKPKVVTAYADGNYLGSSSIITGDTGAATLEQGVGNNAISSIVVPEGQIVTLYDRDDFRGARLEVGGSVESFAAYDFDNKISSVRLGAHVVPTYPRRSVSTAPTDAGGGNVVFLERQNIDCGDDGLYGFKYVHSDTNKLRYDYTCMERIDASNESKSTPYGEHGGDQYGNSGTSTDYLANHIVDCGRKPISRFKLAHHGVEGGTRINYEYTCSNKEALGQCEIRETPFNTERVGPLTFDLQHHNINCNDGEALTQFVFERSGGEVSTGPGTTSQGYKYTCCKMENEA